MFSARTLSQPDATPLSRRVLLAAFCMAPLAGARATTNQLIGADLQRARAKMDAYLDLLDATAPIASGWRRYLSTVSLERGPTGKEIRIGGLATAPDVARALATAMKQTNSLPAWPDCDANATALASRFGEAAPVIAQAIAEHDRNAHRDDEARAVRDHHARLREQVPTLLAARAELGLHLDLIRAELEIAELAEFERNGGRNGRWHIRRATVEARRVAQTMPAKAGPIDIARLDAALAAYEAIVSETETFETGNPGALMAFGRSPRQYLTGMRSLETRMKAMPNTPLALPPHIDDARARFDGLAKFADAFLRPAR